MNADSQSTGLKPRETGIFRGGVIISISLFLLLVIEFGRHTARNLTPRTHPPTHSKSNLIWLSKFKLAHETASIMESIWNRDTGGGTRQYLNRPIISFFGRHSPEAQCSLSAGLLWWWWWRLCSILPHHRQITISSLSSTTNAMSVNYTPLSTGRVLGNRSMSWHRHRHRSPRCCWMVTNPLLYEFTN